jgi:hypothetical protein
MHNRKLSPVMRHLRPSSVLWIVSISLALLPSPRLGAAQTGLQHCMDIKRAVIWEADSFIERILYGNQKRFSIELDGNLVGSGNVRPERSVDPKALNNYYYEALTANNASHSLEIGSALVDYFTKVESRANITYFRVVYANIVIGFGFFGSGTKIPGGPGRPQTVTVFFQNLAGGVMDMQISYSTEVESSCVFRDAVAVIVENLRDD